jgi:anti-sigma-K factor RskA
MNVHDQFTDDLSLYALGALDGEERLALEKHLEECPDCRREVEQLRGDLALLAFSVSGPQPPPRSRERLMEAISREPRRAAVLPGRRKIRLHIFEWAAAAAAVLIIVLLLHENSHLRHRLDSLAADLTGQQQQLHQARALIASISSDEAAHFTLVEGKTMSQPEAKAIYSRRSGTLLFMASDMPQLPAQKTYELWLIPTTGAAIPAGLFTADQHGSATVINPPLPPGVVAKTFAITIEPKSGSPAPTSTPIMVGTPG